VLPCLAHAGSWPSPPVPSGTRTDDVAQHIVFNGLDMHAQTFTSPRSQDDLVEFYRKAWDREVVVNRLGSTQVIGHRDGDYYITVQVSSSGSGSKGNIGVVDVGDAPRHFVPGKGLPAPAGSKVFNDIAYPDDAVPARTVAMRNSLSPAQNTAYFRERLVTDGWKVSDTGTCGDNDCVMRYERGDSKLTLLVMREGATQSQVLINVLQP
jgi:hypothetical protein